MEKEQKITKAYNYDKRAENYAAHFEHFYGLFVLCRVDYYRLLFVVCH